MSIKQIYIAFICSKWNTSSISELREEEMETLTGYHLVYLLYMVI